MLFSADYPVISALIATLFTWAITSIGSAGVFFFKKIDQKVLDATMGFTAGVMIAASFWSLLAPSIELSGEMGMIKWIPPLVGFLGGGLFFIGVDKLLPHLWFAQKRSQAEGISTTWNQTLLTFMAITMHNFPEGLAIGVAFGAASIGVPGATIATATALAIGIGIQNLPEGFAVSMPFRREGLSRTKSFLYGASSALVEPVAGVIGAGCIMFARSLLPFALAFAAGAMIYVTIEEIIPEAQRKSSYVATVGAMLGFAIMMVLDVALS